jgi:gas vesicle protein
MLQRNIKGMIAGAVIGTLVGTMSALFASKPKKILALMKDSKDWANKARDLSGSVYNEMKNWSEPKKVNESPTFIKGAIIGMLLGAGSALLLAPKSGKQLRNNLTQRYQDVADTTSDILHIFNHNGKQPFVKKKHAKPMSHKVQLTPKKKAHAKSTRSH